MKVVVLVPYRSDGSVWRIAAWSYVRRWYARWPIVVGGQLQRGPFNRSAARNEAARLAGEWDAAIVTDADTFVFDLAGLEDATRRASETGRVILPFDHYTALTDLETRDLMAGRITEPPHNRDAEPDPSVGGCVVVPRVAFDALVGWDEGFVGWGFEDSAFHLRAQAIGVERTPGEIIHLWHPPAPEADPKHPLHRANRARAELLGYKIP